MIKSKLSLTAFCLILLFSCQPDSVSTDQEKELSEQKPETSLPFKKIQLNDLSAFKTDGSNWSIKKNVYTDFNDGKKFEVKEGSGVLVNLMDEENKAHLVTSFEHGDFELELEVMMPKGSNSGIYFQGRYELQLLDSYGVEEPSSSDLGGIYQRWDESRPEGQNGYEGHAPLVNASKAPGLWQQLKVYFRAPKIDKDGKKTSNAKFDYVYLNGVLVQEDVEVSGPTRSSFFDDEKTLGPLVIQGDHGNVAFRNISYKSYSQDSLALSNITYKYFDHPYDVVFPEFDTVAILKEGTATFLDVNVANEKQDHYGLIFNADLNVPVSGEYLFHTGVDDGGDMLIDGELVVHNEGTAGYGNTYTKIGLTEGIHKFEFRFYDNVWSARLDIDYEGPGIYNHRLGHKIIPKASVPKKKPLTMTINEVQAPELMRSFIMYNGEKRTHVISVATPQGIHYSYDLQEGSLLRFWRGDFADVTDMWKNRGQPQLLRPLNAAIESIDGVIIEGLEKDNITYVGYSVMPNGLPVFNYTAGGLAWSDQILPTANGRRLKRILSLTSGFKDQKLTIASAPDITKLPNGLHSIDGQYYIDASSAKINGKSLILNAANQSEITYELFW